MVCNAGEASCFPHPASGIPLFLRLARVAAVGAAMLSALRERLAAAFVTLLAGLLLDRGLVRRLALHVATLRGPMNTLGGLRAGPRWLLRSACTLVVIERGGIVEFVGHRIVSVNGFYD